MIRFVGYMGCEVEEVYAVGTRKVLKARGVDTYDSIQATLKMEMDATGQ